MRSQCDAALFLTIFVDAGVVQVDHSRIFVVTLGESAVVAGASSRPTCTLEWHLSSTAKT